jgi:hypothetical protein
LKGEGENNAELKEVMLSGKGLTKLMINHRNQINLEEEINRNMKGKFKLFGHIGLALFLVSALVLALAPVAQAATAVTEVWVDFPFSDTVPNVYSQNAGSEYYIHFKPTTALSRGIDTVTVTWPDGSAAMCGTASTARDFTVTSADETDVYFSTDYGTLGSSANWYRLIGDGVVGGYRVKVKTPIDVAAGQDVWIKFDPDASDTIITACETEAVTYKVSVATSQDTTPVLSRAFAIGDDEVDVVVVTPLVTTAGVTTQYVAVFTPSNQVDIGGTVTLKFPLGTTMPSTISTSDVLFSANGTDYSNSTAATVDADLRTITGTTPVALSASTSSMKILSSAGVGNPQLAATTCKCMLNTSADAQWQQEATGRTHVAGTATKVIVANGEIGLDSVDPYSDDATMINMLSSYIYVTMADQYGNAKDVTGDVTVSLSTSSGTGTFYTADEDDPEGTTPTYSAVTSITCDQADPTDQGQQVFYKDTTAGTHTLTFSASGYTSATWTITVAPAISLYDANNNLVNTYGATSTSPVAEIVGDTTFTSQKYGVDYINDAITAAFAGDTVKLGDGIYELDTAISLDEKITLTSVNGASYTTLRPTTEINWAIAVATSGTATDPVVIDDLTFQRLRLNTDIDCAVRNAGYDYVTVQNCVFNNIEPDDGAATEGVIWFQNSQADLASLTISNNTFNSCCTTWPNMGAWYDYSGCIILDFAGGGQYAVTGVTIDGNTLTDCGQYGITIGGYDSDDEGSGYVTNNTITNGQCAIDVFNNSNNVSITGNTITDAYSYGIYVESTNNAGLVIKNNTITGCAGEYYMTSTTSNGGAIVVENPTSTSDPVIQYNDITGSGSYAIKIDTLSSGGVNCKYNWFGDASGPYYSALTGANISKSNPNGTGDKITDKVVYYPWLYKSRTDVVADNVSYQTSNMKLVSGWNTMSTPVKLISTADSIDELIPSGMTIGYYYDGGWQQITTGYVLNACDAVYVKMSAATYVQFKFDAGAFTTPSKSLDAGWNLIGLASLDASKDATDAVASVDLTAGNLPGWSQLISPSMNAAQTDIYGATETAWSESSGQSSSETMQPGLGYWIYMQNAATLAGFELTPIVPDLD